MYGVPRSTLRSNCVQHNCKVAMLIKLPRGFIPSYVCGASCYSVSVLSFRAFQRQGLRRARRRTLMCVINEVPGPCKEYNLSGSGAHGPAPVSNTTRLHPREMIQLPDPRNGGPENEAQLGAVLPWRRQQQQKTGGQTNIPSPPPSVLDEDCW